jgi:hypothetical protein
LSTVFLIFLIKGTRQETERGQAKKRAKKREGRERRRERGQAERGQAGMLLTQS